MTVYELSILKVVQSSTAMGVGLCGGVGVHRSPSVFIKTMTYRPSWYSLKHILHSGWLYITPKPIFFLRRCGSLMFIHTLHTSCIALIDAPSIIHQDLITSQEVVLYLTSWQTDTKCLILCLSSEVLRPNILHTKWKSLFSHLSSLGSLAFCSLGSNQISDEGVHVVAAALQVNQRLQELK